MNKTTALEAFRRFWWVALLFALAGGVLGALPEPASKADTVTSYSASFSMLISSDDVNGVYGNTLINQIKTFAIRGEVPKRAAVALGQPESSGPATKLSRSRHKQRRPVASPLPRAASRVLPSGPGVFGSFRHR